VRAPGDCGRRHDTGAYVLGALDERGRAAFEEHLRTCEGCREEVEELRVAADALPLAAEQVVPPPTLRDRVMAVVREEAAVLAAAGPEADAPPAAPAHPSPAATGPASAARPGRGAPWWRRALPALRPLPAAALAAVLLGLGVLAGAQLSGGGDGEARVVTAEVAAPSARAEVVVEDDRARLVVAGLPAAPRGQVYQVWVQRPGGDPAPTDALFRTTAGGRASVDVPGRIGGVERVLVSREPDGGSRAPTSDPVVVATLG
jgi:anti-sigma factor RsiW